MFTKHPSTPQPSGTSPAERPGADPLAELTDATRGDVVAAVDGSPASLTAAAWAAEEAERLGRPLHLIYVIEPEILYNPYYSAEQLREDSQQALSDAAHRLRDGRPGLQVLDHLVIAKTWKALVDGSQGAALLVLGRRGHGALGRLLLGSVSARVAGNAVVPTAVVPKTWVAQGVTSKPVVVGVDGSPASDAALRYAAQLAAHRGAPLRIVSAWGHDPTFAVDPAVTVSRMASWRTEVEALLDDAATACRLTFPELDISTDAPHGPTVNSLVAESDDAQALVVGGRKVSRLQATLVGSTTYGVLHQCNVPVIVLHTSH